MIVHQPLVRWGRDRWEASASSATYEPLDPVRADLPQHVRLQGGAQVQPKVVAVVLLVALGDVPQLQVLEPQVAQFIERAWQQSKRRR